MADTKLHLISNGVFTTSIAGGDIHFLKLAEAAARAGYSLNFFGGHALQEVVRQHLLPGTVTLTDSAAMAKVNQGALSGQLAMFRDFLGRYRRTVTQLRGIAPEDFVYAVSDYWFDVLPAVRAAARRKLMVLHMEAPTFDQILHRKRPDVDPMRLASFHYWASQEWSLRRFCACSDKHIFHLHPAMVPRLKEHGVLDREMTHLSYGVDVAATDAASGWERLYDVVWIGRVHRQKGIDDLLTTLQYLAGRLKDFRAVFIGNVRDALAPQLAARGLEKHVEFSGFVSEAEKIRLFKASRVFLMPSRHEGSPRVIGESIIAGTPVVAYDIPNYRPIFGDFIRYVPAFNLDAYRLAAEDEVRRMRIGENDLVKRNLAQFKHDNSWATTQARFLAALERMGGIPGETPAHH